MPEDKDVKKSDSSTEGVKNGGSPTAQELLAKATAESERLKGALNSLQNERDEIKTRLEQLEDIENRRNLSAKEEVERRLLERGEDSIEDQIQELKRKPENKAFFTHFERKLAEAVKMASSEATLMQAADFLEETAEELASKDQYKDMTDEKLLKLIKPYMGQFENKSAYRKTKLAYRTWQEAETYKREKAEIAKKKAEESLSNENGSRLPRQSTAQEIFDKKGNLESSEKAILREKLGIMQRQK